MIFEDLWPRRLGPYFRKPYVILVSVVLHTSVLTSTCKSPPKCLSTPALSSLALVYLSGFPGLLRALQLVL